MEDNPISVNSALKYATTDIRSSDSASFSAQGGSNMDDDDPAQADHGAPMTPAVLVDALHPDDDDLYMDAVDVDEPGQQALPLGRTGALRGATAPHQSQDDMLMEVDDDGTVLIHNAAGPSGVPDLDLSHSVKGMYRVLDLINEPGSGGGLVDKIIISQDGLQAFANDVQPGAYTSLTKVDFKLLDNIMIQPVGIYGDKKAIVDFLQNIDAISGDTVALLLRPEDEGEKKLPSLRSGLYVLRCAQSQGEGDRVYVIYWPEDTTWNDSAISSVRRNRITFMRYLSKLCDQTMALMSADYSKSIVWKESEDEDSCMDSDDEGSERMYAFEVCKTNEQEESVKVRPGFTTRTPYVMTSPDHVERLPENVNIISPRLIPGETTQGLLTAGYKAAKKHVDRFNDRTMAKTLLDSYLKDPQIRLTFGESLDQYAVDILVESSLRTRCGPLCRKFISERSEARQRVSSEISERKAEVMRKLKLDLPLLTNSIRDIMIGAILDHFPTLDRERLRQKPPVTSTDAQNVSVLKNIVDLHPRVQGVLTRARNEQPLRVIGTNLFQGKKEAILVTTRLLANHSEQLDLQKQTELANMILHADNLKSVRKVWVDVSKGTSVDDKSKGLFDKVSSGIKSLLSLDDSSAGEEAFRRAIDATRHISDAEFLADLGDILFHWPLLEESVDSVNVAVYDYFNKQLGRLSDRYANEALHIQQEGCTQQFEREEFSRMEQTQRGLCFAFVRRLNKHFSNISSKQEFHIESILKTGYTSYRSPTLSVKGHIDTIEDPKVMYSVHPMQLSTEHRHNMQLDASFIPTPRFGLAYTFSLPVGYDIVFVRLLENDSLLLLTSDRGGNVLVFRERLEAMQRAVNEGRYKSKLSHDKIGEDFLIAFNETKQILAVCEAQKLQLHIFIFDEGARALKASGSAINLAPWYDGLSIRRACFVCGDEELLLVDASCRGRIFSLVTMQFRPASLQLPSMPSAIYSSPDGSCFLTAGSQGRPCAVTAYHWSTFGSNAGTELVIDNLAPSDEFILTSLGSRNSVHLMKLDIATQSCKSVVLDITRKSTEFMFREKSMKATSTGDRNNATVHNCLIDCHSDVWTRFPVLPAVQRQAITTASLRSPKTLTFISDFARDRFSPHFDELIQTFERSTRKLTGNELRSITIQSISTDDLYAALDSPTSSQISQFRAGEWLVELLCLIPIHLAITKDNRFIPLKDGVFSPEMEKSLLGAEVGRIVDSLSFGWYESIFQSYMASKPVKVVSSMGEQSVGKSYALNHLVDTSFAGSAMRTTEGVWMSVTPTEETLIVALDFEGVHSIERSAQEDTLLVLFNTAVSNLVLFRNNFALSRDITGLFQSFQSSSTVLDPTANPMLFQSTLVIIIKDVVDSDKVEITREFSLKFHKIVQDEQESNFISQLHGGKLDIIPWPVIESKEFYKLFSKVKKRLDHQVVTHKSAGQFLLTAKTLMAKLKANDWGALSHTMAAHRALLLHSMLTSALESGFAINGTEKEPLKNMDTDELISMDDTLNIFDLGASSTAREARLDALAHSWDQFSSRQQMGDDIWLEGLWLHIDHLLALRINRVGEWVTSNLARFQAVSHESIEDLKRAFEGTTVDMRSNAQICRAQCASCHLHCIQSRLHQGQHDCKTDHRCSHHCNFCEDGEIKLCGMNAGHPGRHICIVSSHLCGELCTLFGRQGCLEACTKVVDHEDAEHKCAATIHACGEPCSLKGIKLADGLVYNCPDGCSIPSDRKHTQHHCQTRMCPIPCLLCKRLCANQDHLHGLHQEIVHLCGQEHLCKHDCSQPGICDIDTAPLSIEATFTGRHETFQYTKYSQVSKRLKCVKPIPPGATEHTGTHTHSLDPNVIHFCEKRCEHCSYFCTLPLGHPQKEHETRHGSMSQTRWAIDGDDNDAIEVEGRRYAANDDGAPMMCNLVCQSMGRHAHISYCRSTSIAECNGNDQVQHIQRYMRPEPDRAKDSITHSLFWKRTGFKDPYSREEQANFAKCDAMCGGPEHTPPGAAPSYCILPLFHPLRDPATASATGYISSDGHHFACRNPVVLQQAFHVIFVVDRSSSMGDTDRLPLQSTPTSDLITRHANNRLGAVYSALHSFWSARHAAITAGGHQANLRRDAYSIILFDQRVTTALVNDFGSSPEQLLNVVLGYRPKHGTNFTDAMRQAQAIMEGNWSTERTPIVIFLSDGECRIEDEVTQDLCRSAIGLGKPVSLQTVSFGPDRSSYYLRRMAEIAARDQSRAPRDALTPAAATVTSAFSQALDSVQLAETFLGFAESLRKQRGSLIH